MRSQTKLRAAVDARPLTVAVSLALFVVFSFLFRTIIATPEIGSDLRAHVGFAKSAFEGTGAWPRHFLYFFLVALTSFWTTSLSVWHISGWIWLSIFVVAKFLAIVWFGTWWLKLRHRSQNPATRRFVGEESVVIGIALCLTVVFCLPQPRALAQGLWYAYAFPPNTWHNATQIAVMPFAVVSFGLSILQFKDPCNLRRAFAIAAVTALSAFAKPSFVMSWMPSYGLCLLLLFLGNRSIRQVLISATPIGFAAVVIALQYYFIYAVTLNQTSIQIGYLEAWLSRSGRFATHFYISVILSSLFPITFYLFYHRALKKMPHVLAISMAAASYVYAFALSEAGEVQSGNFMWPIISANFILYMLCVFDLRAESRTEELQWRGKIPLKVMVPAATFLLSTLSGLIYIVRYVVTGGYG